MLHASCSAFSQLLPPPPPEVRGRPGAVTSCTPAHSRCTYKGLWLISSVPLWTSCRGIDGQLPSHPGRPKRRACAARCIVRRCLIWSGPLQMFFKVFNGYRPPMPEGTPKGMKDLMEACWSHNPAERPSFRFITRALQRLIIEVRAHRRPHPRYRWLLVQPG